jgi:hypothetical protein
MLKQVLSRGLPARMQEVVVNVAEVGRVHGSIGEAPRQAGKTTGREQADGPHRPPREHWRWFSRTSAPRRSVLDVVEFELSPSPADHRVDRAVGYS